MILIDFQNNLYYMVVQTANSILEVKKKEKKVFTLRDES